MEKAVQKRGTPGNGKAGLKLSSSGIQSFKLKRQNRPRAPSVLSPEQIQARTHPRTWQKRPDLKVKRQASVTLSTTSTTIIVPTLTITESGTVTTKSGTLVVVVEPSTTITAIANTLTSSPIQMAGSPSGTNGISSPGQSGIVTTFPGSISGQVITTTVFSNPIPHPSNTGSPFAAGLPSRNSRQNLAAIVVGSVIGLILILLCVCLFLRWKKRRRPGQVLLAEPFSEMRGSEQWNVAMPQPSAFGAAMLTYRSDPLMPKTPPAKYSEVHQARGHGTDPRQDSISPSNSPPGSNMSLQDTMLEIQALRQRIMEVENMALQQRIADVQTAQNSPGAAQSTEHPPLAGRVDRASESPPEYTSPVDETRLPVQGQN